MKLPNPATLELLIHSHIYPEPHPRHHAPTFRNADNFLIATGLAMRSENGGLDVTDNGSKYIEECLQVRRTLDRYQKMVQAEHALNNAYIRLRNIIPGAFDTPQGASPQVVWDHVEARLKILLKEAEQAGEDSLKGKRLLQEALNMCEVGDLNENSDDGIGWAGWIREVKSWLKIPMEIEVQIKPSRLRIPTENEVQIKPSSSDFTREQVVELIRSVSDLGVGFHPAEWMIKVALEAYKRGFVADKVADAESDRDAVRYRKLRALHWSDAPFCVVENPKRNLYPGSPCPSGDGLDALVDALSSTEPAKVEITDPHDMEQGKISVSMVDLKPVEVAREVRKAAQQLKPPEFGDPDLPKFNNLINVLHAANHHLLQKTVPKYRYIVRSKKGLFGTNDYQQAIDASEDWYVYDVVTGKGVYRDRAWFTKFGTLNIEELKPDSL